MLMKDFVVEDGLVACDSAEAKEAKENIVFRIGRFGGHWGYDSWHLLNWSPVGEVLEIVSGTLIDPSTNARSGKTPQESVIVTVNEVGVAA
ncbi:hypothetical protein EWM64_g1294 [Hericium alpestre]|uniref:Uncharacterized protein n=1 Tax=Hericium alpestre TaxID=135208 RepID=A0A4Z0A7J8_9AGAM|nr:hypothetical protein EWM64_g1294 [Hericium alpestre]